MHNRSAEVIFGTHKPIRCVILDMSDGGARLAGFACPIANLPPAFTLSLFEDIRVRRDCEVVWANKRCMGVKFKSEWYGAVNPSKFQAHDAVRI